MNETIISRIQKLFALGASPNENEAAAALEKAHVLLREYNLSMADLPSENKTDAKITESVYATEQKTRQWCTIIINGVCKANYCAVYLVPRKIDSGRIRATYEWQIRIVGREHNVAGAIAMADYLIGVVDRLSKKYNGHERNSYRQGVAATLYARLLAMAKADKQSTDAQTTALVVREDRAVDDYLHALNLLKHRGSTSIASNFAFGQGRADGQLVSLNRQVNGSQSASGLIG